MNSRILLPVVLLAMLAVGVIIGRSLPAPGAGDSAPAGDREILYWVAPMDPNYRRDEPGKSPMGMDLVPVYADEVDRRPGVVAIDPVVESNLGVRTALAGYGPLTRRIDTVGYVGYDEDTLQHVHTRVDGWIEQLAVKAAGESVAAGQLLFELYSPTLVNAQQEYLAARGSGIDALLEASRDRLAALGVAAGEIRRLESERSVRQRIGFYAERDGIVTQLGVREGIYVTPATDVMTIADLGQVWVIAEVFERDAAWVQSGQEAEVRLDYLPGEVWTGEVDYVYPELDPRTRTLRVRLRLDNPGERLQPNMFARVEIAGDATDPLVHVPRAAVIRGGKLDRVVVALGDGRFRAQPVEIGLESGDRVAILEGLRAGEPVVVSAQFLIDSEANIASALSRMSQEQAGTGLRHDHGEMQPEPPQPRAREQEMHAPEHGESPQ